MKKLILTLLFCVIPACGWGVSLIGSGVVNLLLSPTDFSDPVWNPYPEHSFVDNGDGSQTITQSQGGSAWDSYMFSKQSTYNHVNLVQDQEYVFRIRMKTDLETYIHLVANKPGDGAGGAETGDVNVITRPWNMFGNDFIQMHIVFKANVTGSNQGTIEIRDFFSGSTADYITIIDAELLVHNGYTIYSCGDSICNFATTYTLPFVSGNTQYTDSNLAYTNQFCFDNRVTAFKNAVSGAQLAAIYSAMQIDLAATSYPMIIIEGGVNDITTGNTILADMQSTMTNMITLAKTKADKVVVFNIPPINTGGMVQERLDTMRDYNLWLPGECAAQGVQMFDFFDVLGDGSGVHGLGRDMTFYINEGSGGAHPNALGHRAVVNEMNDLIDFPSTSLSF